MGEEDNESLQDAADSVIERLEVHFIERWGGAWLRWEPIREICIGVVAPTAEDVEFVSRLADQAGWAGTTVAVRYSWAQLKTLQEQLMTVSGVSVISLGPDVELNKIGVVLNEYDVEAIKQMYAAVPRDVLVISVQPRMEYRLLRAQRTG